MSFITDVTVSGEICKGKKIMTLCILLMFQVERMDREKGSWLACGRSKENTFLARGLIQGHEYREDAFQKDER